jgi:GTP-binding protein Era
MQNDFKSGFIAIIGKPNVGKSTLLNALLGQKLVITTAKAQTTRHRILGIHNDEKCQIVFSDTPGIIDPAHELHKQMMVAVTDSLEDADVILYMIEAGENAPDETILERLKAANVPVTLVINKAETIDEDLLKEKADAYKLKFDFDDVIPVSALHSLNTLFLLEYLKNKLPIHPAYFPNDQLSDRNDRFFVSEFIRKHILLQYSKEIPYATEVVIDEYKELKKLDHIRATIFVERESQKPILIGRGGMALKKLGEAAREEIEEYLQKKVFLGLTIKVREKWRSDDSQLTYFGYKQ